MNQRSAQKISRAASVTGGLSIAGAIAGGAVAAGTLGVLALVVDGPGGFPEVWDAFLFAALAGAFLGGIIVPLFGWLFLRRVAFGRLFATTAIGAIFGGTIGLLASGLDAVIALAGATAGFAVSVGWLRFRQQLGTSAQPSR